MTRTIIRKAEQYSAIDLFKALYKLEELKRQYTHLFLNEKLDMLLLPSLPAIYTRQEVRDNPIETNSDNGFYCNFMNLLDMCGIAVPSGIAVSLNNGKGTSTMPFGVTLAAPCWQDMNISRIASVYMQKYCNSKNTP